MGKDPLFIAAFCATLAGILFFAWGGKSKARDNADFSLGGRRAGSWSVAGAITGTLVGGASTVGTAQLAFLYGLSAWWFTLGAGLACLFLGIFLAVPLRNSNVETIPQFISRYYGERARVAASLFSALGMFIQIVAQLLACGALLAVLFDLSLLWSASISALLVIFFTLGGGMKSAGSTGLIKMFLIYLTMVAAGILALQQAGGLSRLAEPFPDFPWFSLFGYGVQEGISDLLSMIVGVVSTQTYLQAIFSASGQKTARSGAFVSALIIPPLGLLGVLVGLYMRQTSPDLNSALTLPTFISQNFPTLFAGIAFAALLIAAVGTASGLALGVSTTLKVDVLQRWFSRWSESLAFFRTLTTVVVAGAFVLLLFNLGSAIMDWSFLSMGLRGATICFPLLFAVFFRQGISRRAGVLSIFLAPATVVVAGVLQVQFISPLYLGLGTSFLLLLGGFVQQRFSRH
ncbi:solute:Na+ symporter, SSS family [Malonomonas rubra DSM 5091]|uniref:Solute:Na+ symporter, SSS family n=1 Tax=Malonomonas rubra DSM 5091 TaxID=1122189 RepID=A0A1M6HZT7_MALRU|nr:sodium:solute symporter family protein [Malonomonas rubra]SHJ27746.1 solute:Na+ symporter, SSS family [Malonomonas rubra DSM 5091]